MDDGENICTKSLRVAAFGDLLLDNEPFYQCMESAPLYQGTMKAIHTEEITSVSQKANVAVFLLSRIYRHPSTIASLLEQSKRRGLERWEALIEIRKLFTTPDWVCSQTTQIMIRPWVLHVTAEHSFPLPDFAVLISKTGKRVWSALSPRLLLEIQLDGSLTDEVCFRRTLDPQREKSTLENYRRLAIGSATTEIIFHDAQILETWRASFECREKVRHFQDLKGSTAPQKPLGRTDNVARNPG